MKAKEDLKKAIENDDMMMVAKALKNAPDGTTVSATFDSKTRTFTKENGLWLAPEDPEYGGRDYTTSSDLAEEWVYGTELTIL